MTRAIDLATELAEGFALPPGGIPLEDLERMTLGGTKARWHARHCIARHDDAMTRFVSTAYVACGMHSGDPVLLGRVVKDLAEKGIAVGVHPSYPDVFGFGQRRVSMTPDQLRALLLYQFGAVSAVAKGAGTTMTSVKCHGALGFDVSYDEAIAAIMADAILRFDPSLTLVCMARSPGVAVATNTGVKVAREAYVDRGYDENARIVPRNHPSALITDVDKAVAQALSIALAGEVASVDGKVIPLEADTLCMHSDTPGADRIAAALRAALERKGIQVRSCSSRMSFMEIGDEAQRRFGWKMFTSMRYLASGEVERVHTSAPDTYPLGGRKPRRDTPWSRQVLVRGEPYFANDEAGIRFAFEDAVLILSLGLGAVINAPVKDGARVLGTLNFLREAGGYRPEHVAQAEALALSARELLR